MAAVTRAGRLVIVFLVMVILLILLALHLLNRKDKLEEIAIPGNPFVAGR